MKMCSGVKVVEVNGFLKQRTTKDHFQCWGSNITYSIKHYSYGVCLRQEYSNPCTNDPYFYQACGSVHRECQNQYLLGGTTLCGLHVCTYRSSRPPHNIHSISGKSVSWYFDCNGHDNCLNPDNPGFDEKFCDIADSNHECVTSGKMIPDKKRCNGVVDCLPDFADDEANCNHEYGIDCFSRQDPRISIWLPPTFICDRRRGKNFRCKDDIDEAGCDETVGWCQWRESRNKNSGELSTRFLVASQMCSPNISPLVSPCIDGRDQLNCTSVTHALTCKVDGYPTSITKLGLCRGFPICDDGLDELCGEAEIECTTHKHTLCDDISDCPHRGDELQTTCDNLVKDNVTCVRAVNYGEAVPKRIPADWLCDGVVDCQNGIDEEMSHWKQCGSPWTKLRCIEKENQCEELYKCDRGNNNTKLIDLRHLCDAVSSCENEERVCEKSRSRETEDVPSASVAPIRKSIGTKLLVQCLPGLFDLPRISGYDCALEEFSFFPKGYGLLYEKLNFPSKLISGSSCLFLYGEQYVYMSCMDQCPNQVVSCPLRPLSHSSCLNIRHRIFTVSQDHTSLVMVKRKSKFGFVNERLFPCDNGICISLDRVCNLANDCGDNSDEIHCKNHYKCASGELIPISKKCDGEIHCRDASDECVDCGLRIIPTVGLRVFAWAAGLIAMTVNGIVIGLNIRDLVACKSGTAFISNSLLTVIAVGDFLIGIYLFSIAVIDMKYKDSFCRERYEWLISKGCSSLGVLNTMGMQLSLFAMTVLSVFRAVVVQRRRPSVGVTKQDYLISSIIIGSVLIISTSISTIPLFTIFEDFFLNGLYYGTLNPLFVGVPDKMKHMDILEAYYGRFRSPSSKSRVKLNWKTIRDLIGEMFTADHGGITGRNWGFYGNAPVCVFKFFVKHNDPQLAYSWGLLGINFICFTVIAGCYTLVNFISAKSSHISSSKGKDKTRKLQRKIAMIIATDFACWVPFITIALLHYLEIVDGTDLYLFCSTILLPINCILNPLLYQNNIVDWISHGIAALSSILCQCKISHRFSNAVNPTVASFFGAFYIRGEAAAVETVDEIELRTQRISDENSD